MSDVLVDRTHLDSLLEAMLAVPGVSDSDVRDAQMEELVRIMRRPVEAARFADSRHDLSSLINACLACSGGLRTFAHVLQHYAPGEASTRVVSLADTVVGDSLLSTSDRDTLRRNLAAIPVGQVADAVGELVEGDGLRSLAVWRDLPAAIRKLESLPTPDDGVPQLLTFADRLAHVVSGMRAADLRRWVETVAGGLGVDEARLAEVRAASERGVTGGRLSAAPAQRTGSGENGALPRPQRVDDAGLIWGGGVPIRNRSFTGRTDLLDRLSDALRTTSKASVLPQTLQGMGGVGKTQLVVEYVYRHLEEYDIVWWIPAEQTSSVLVSLAQLAERLGLPTTEDRQRTARTVLDALAGTELSWLLVYDNADDPASLNPYVPSSGGHVVLTTRNQEFATVGQAIEVDVFLRHESIEMLQRRSRDDNTGVVGIPAAEANVLAEKLGDLPLALEQAAAWCVATAMPVKEYIELLDSHVRDLLSEGKPANYPVTVAAFVALAVEKLRGTLPAAAQMFELFAYLGGEPVAMSLLRRGKDADIAEPLRETLGSSIPTNRMVRELNRLGLAKLDALQRVQVHRLVQRVLRDSLSPEQASTTKRNTQRLLAKANPGDPDDNPTEMRDDLGPHIDPADVINAVDVESRHLVLDHIRHLWVTGDYENSLQLAERAASVWAGETFHPRLGPNGELTLRAQAQIANSRRVLGQSTDASTLARETYDRFRRSPDLGERHEYTLITGIQIGADLRIQGKYREALDFDRELVTLHREVFEPDSSYTLRARANLAVDYRMIGDFAEAYRIDQEIADRWDDVSASDPRALAAYINLARNCYGLGAYQRGLDLVERWRPTLNSRLGTGHGQVLLAGRTLAILLRKLGRLDEAAEVIKEYHDRTKDRFGESHEFTLAVMVSYANVLRETGQLDDAAELIDPAVAQYEEVWGPQNPLTLTAQIDKAILCRARGQFDQARLIDEPTYELLGQVLGPSHPYTICAGVGLATDHARAGEHEAAVELSQQMYNLSEETAGGVHEARDGAAHPYHLMRAVNLSIDLRATGQTAAADLLFADALAGLHRALGSDHPDVLATERRVRTEGDIEAPPT